MMSSKSVILARVGLSKMNADTCTVVNGNPILILGGVISHLLASLHPLVWPSRAPLALNRSYVTVQAFRTAPDEAPP